MTDNSWKPSILPACSCDTIILSDDDRLHRCDACGGYLLGIRFGKPIEKYGGSYEYRPKKTVT